MKLFVTLVQYVVCSWTAALIAAVMGSFCAVVIDGRVTSKDLKNFLYFWYYPYILKT